MLNDQQWTSVGFDFRTTGAGHGGVYSFSSDGQYAVGWDDSRPAVWKYNSDFEGDLTNPSDYAYLRGLGITQVNGVVNPIG